MPGVIGISAISATLEGAVPPTAMPASESTDGNSSIGSIDGLMKGFGSFGPGALLLVPFALAYDAVHNAGAGNDGARNDATCDADLKSAYPDASAKLRNIVQHESSLRDIEEQFVGTFHKQSVSEVVAFPSSDGPRGLNEQQLLDAAAQQRLAYLFVIEVTGAGLARLNAQCQWAFGVGLNVSLWSVTDRYRVAGPLASYPYVNGRSAVLQTMMEQPGAIRTRLAPNFGNAAEAIIDKRAFVLPR
jgi:hypothetical protein